MPMYQRKPFKAVQWNKRGDAPSFAYGKIVESEDWFVLTSNEKTITGGLGDYICQRPDGSAVYVCKRETFEACNSPIEDAENTISLLTVPLEKLREVFMKHVANGELIEAATIALFICYREKNSYSDIINENAFRAFKNLKAS